MENIEITAVSVKHIEALQNVGKQTFSETFSSTNAEEDMKRYLDENFSLAKLTEELNNKESLFYFATINEKVIGYLKLNFGTAQTELKDNTAVEIERIYVLKAFQGKKVGQLLYQKAIQFAKQRNAAYVWLGVWEDNIKAIHFYRKNGFVEFSKHIFRLGNDEQTDIMMKLELKEN
ncbi:MAG: GNAT family N-acetyltransferase [Chitinophagaceae bacterium]|nr:GNAT family N-acetyltransferase [Chitinophagaceae bacterium]